MNRFLIAASSDGRIRLYKHIPYAVLDLEYGEPVDGDDLDDVDDSALELDADGYPLTPDLFEERV